MTNQKAFVFLESNTTGTGDLLVRKALAKNLHPIFITANPKKYSFLPLEKVELVVLDTSDQNILLDYLQQIENLIGLHSSSDASVEIASSLAQKLGLPGACYQSVKLCRNKYSLYQALKSSDINVPHTQRILNLDEARIALAKWSFPVVIKPSNGTGSKGVKLCQTKDEYWQHIDLLFQNNYREVLIQEYIDAPEFSVEVCSFNNKQHILGITRKYLGQLPNFIETGHDFPATLSAEETGKIKQLVANLLTILDFNFGFSHVEFKVKNEKIILIEANPRLAGGMIPNLIEKSTGIDLLGSLLDLYTGHGFDLQIEYKKFASIRHFIPNHAGEIKYFNFKDASLVDEVKILKNTGDNFTPQGDFRDRIAYFIVSDENHMHCQNKAYQAMQNFAINIKTVE